MPLHGHSLIAGATHPVSNARTFTAFDPAQNRPLPQEFFEVSEQEIEAALGSAEVAARFLERQHRSYPAALLEAIADEIEALGSELIEMAARETGLGATRLTGERGRTTGQLRLFAAVLREGSWLRPRIDRALPHRVPPRPDIRLTVLPLGPVAVFSASNFPFAFSVAGGDTASALAAGCPVIVKAHPSHPGTSEMVGTAIVAAVSRVGAPAGIFSLLQSAQPATSIRLVRDHRIRAVGFTGSLQGGRAIFDAGVTRPDPIPVYAEMASVNPVFLLPSAVSADPAKLASAIFASVTLGAGQFCTSPGLIIGTGLEMLATHLRALFRDAAPATMLSPGIAQHYSRRVAETEATLATAVRNDVAVDGCSPVQGVPALFETDAAIFASQPALRTETFGASTILVHCRDVAEMESVAQLLEGTLTATVHGTPDDVVASEGLISILQRKSGRLIFNGFPTGVEVCHAMHHGGPYPSTSNVKFTSVGTAAMERWVRPICFQDAPEAILPEELKDANPLGVLRMIDGVETRAGLLEEPSARSGGRSA